MISSENQDNIDEFISEIVRLFPEQLSLNEGEISPEAELRITKCELVNARKVLEDLVRQNQKALTQILTQHMFFNELIMKHGERLSTIGNFQQQAIHTEMLEGIQAEREHAEAQLRNSRIAAEELKNSLLQKIYDISSQIDRLDDRLAWMIRQESNQEVLSRLTTDRLRQTEAYMQMLESEITSYRAVIDEGSLQLQEQQRMFYEAQDVIRHLQFELEQANMCVFEHQFMQEEAQEAHERCRNENAHLMEELAMLDATVVARDTHVNTLQNSVQDLSQRLDTVVSEGQGIIQELQGQLEVKTATCADVELRLLNETRANEEHRQTINALQAEISNLRAINVTSNNPNAPAPTTNTQSTNKTRKGVMVYERDIPECSKGSARKIASSCSTHSFPSTTLQNDRSDELTAQLAEQTSELETVLDQATRLAYQVSELTSENTTLKERHFEYGMIVTDRIVVLLDMVQILKSYRQNFFLFGFAKKRGEKRKRESDDRDRSVNERNNTTRSRKGKKRAEGFRPETKGPTVEEVDRGEKESDDDDTDYNDSTSEKHRRKRRLIHLKNEFV